MKRFPVVVLCAVVLSGIAAGQYIEATITVGTAPTAMAYDSIDRKVFVANNGSNTVSVINAANNSVVATVNVGDKPVAMCWSQASNKVYVSCAPFAGNGSVYVINAATNGVVTSVDVGANPAALVWCSARNKVYCLNVGSNTITVINCPDDEPVTTIAIPDQLPVDIAYNPANDQVYFTTAQLGTSGKVRAVNCSSDEIVATVVAGVNPGALAVNPVGNRVYAANKSSNTVTVVNGATNQGLGHVRVQQEPTPLLWTPQNKLFVGEYWGNSVAFMHGDSMRIQGRITVPGNPKTLIYVPGTQKVFCTNLLAGKVSLLDARNGHEDLVMDLLVGGGPLPMAVYPAENRVFVGNSWDNTVTAIKDIVAIEEGGARLPPAQPRISAWPNPARIGQTVHLRSGAGAEVRDAAGRIVGCGPTWVPTATGVYFLGRTAGKLVVE